MEYTLGEKNTMSPALEGMTHGFTTPEKALEELRLIVTAYLTSQKELVNDTFFKKDFDDLESQYIRLIELCYVARESLAIPNTENTVFLQSFLNYLEAFALELEKRTRIIQNEVCSVSKVHTYLEIANRKIEFLQDHDEFWAVMQALCRLHFYFDIFSQIARSHLLRDMNNRFAKFIERERSNKKPSKVFPQHLQVVNRNVAAWIKRTQKIQDLFNYKEAQEYSQCLSSQFDATKKEYDRQQFHGNVLEAVKQSAESYCDLKKAIFAFSVSDTTRDVFESVKSIVIKDAREWKYLVELLVIYFQLSQMEIPVSVQEQLLTHLPYIMEKLLEILEQISFLEKTSRTAMLCPTLSGANLTVEVAKYASKIKTNWTTLHSTAQVPFSSQADKVYNAITKNCRLYLEALEQLLQPNGATNPRKLLKRRPSFLAAEPDLRGYATTLKKICTEDETRETSYALSPVPSTGR